MKFLLISAVLVGVISFFCCVIILKYFKLSIKHENLKIYIKKITNLVSSARYGNLYSRIDLNKDKTTEELSKNLNNLLESILDRDVMINEYVEKEKEETNLKEDFIASLTHDLKVPIIAQDNTFDLLLAEKFGTLTDIQKEAIVKLKISNMDLKYLIEALLETYKAEHKGVLPKKESGIQVNNFIKETIEQLSSIFKLHNKKIDFTTELANNFTADIDIFLTKRVINNLILNALSYSANSDKIDIFLKHTDKGFSISIKDYGIGIEKEDIDKIFNKFYSGKSNLKQASTGLGLYLSNKIIKALGGTIEVKSEKNKGSVFTITLPVK